MNLLDLSGKVALVTGAGQGVGRQTVLHLAAHGAPVVVNDFFLDRAEAVVKEVEAAGGKAFAVQADVGDLGEVQEMFARAHEKFGRVDVVINNAGNMGPNYDSVTQAKFWEAPVTDWDYWIRVNFNGVMNCCYAALPGMIERKAGRLITVISDAGRVGEPRLAVYSGAKAGAAGFMRSIARETARFNVTCNNVAIGTTRTPALTASISPEMEAKFAKSYPLGRIGEPSDVANMMVFLASDASSFITGQTYPVNGGFSFNL